MSQNVLQVDLRSCAKFLAAGVRCVVVNLIVSAAKGGVPAVLDLCHNVDYQSLTATCELHLPTTNVFLNCFTKPAQPPLSQGLHLKKTAKPQSYLHLRKLQPVLPNIIPTYET